MGNHDYWYAHGVPNPKPDTMTEEEVRHHAWSHGQIGNGPKKSVAQWKFHEELTTAHGKIRFQHYGINRRTHWFEAIIKIPDRNQLNRLFAGANAAMIFYGHNHQPSDIRSETRYVNLGSAGCYDRPEVRLGILHVTPKTLRLTKYSVPYEDNGLMEAYDERCVPAKDYIRKNFITRN